MNKLIRWMNSLRWRVVLSYVVLIGAALILISVLLVHTLDQFFEKQAIDDLRMRAEIVAYNIGAQPSSYGGVAQVASQQLQVRVRVFTDLNTLIYDSSRQSSTIPPSHAPGLQPDTRLTVTSTLLLGNTAWGYVELSAPLTYRHATLEAIRGDLVQLALLTLLAAVVLGIVLGGSLTAPLHRLTRAAERLATGDLTVDLPPTGPSEIDNLSRAFITMAQRLKESFAALSGERDHLREFVADVSHELRTPITALRTFNELLLQGAQEDPDVRQEFLTESAAQIARLDWLTQNLLDLSKLEAGLLPMRIEEADLVITVQRALFAHQPSADHKGVTIIPDLFPTALMVPHDTLRLEQAIGNVLNNAIKFTPAGGQVTLRVVVAVATAETTTDDPTTDDAVTGDSTVMNGRALVQVRDTGPGIAAGDLPHIFERFYRGKELTTGSSGSGLGLAIVKQIMESHHGDVEVRSAPGHGAVVTLSLPLLSPPHNAGLQQSAPLSPRTLVENVL